VYLPYLKELYDTDGVHAFLNREKLPQPHVELNENAGFIVTETIYRRWKIDFQGAIFSLGSVAAHLCYLAKGSAIGLMTQGSLWDLAGGAAIVSQLGIEFRYLSGDLLDFKDLYNGQNAREMVIVSSPEHFKVLAQALEPKSG
ncbi:MAG: hypothetical protein HY731_10095, partial [Candidatus Tectomicrobia bacterium]|nr:hypothetical protein [Candidatus Tectomicrobia bacterium]